MIVSGIGSTPYTPNLAPAGPARQAAPATPVSVDSDGDHDGDGAGKGTRVDIRA